MSLFDELMKQQSYKKLFEMFPDDQKQIIMDRIKKLLDDSEENILKQKPKNSNQK